MGLCMVDRRAAATIQLWFRERKNLQRLGLTELDTKKAGYNKTFKTLALVGSAPQLTFHAGPASLGAMHVMA